MAGQSKPAGWGGSPWNRPPLAGQDLPGELALLEGGALAHGGGRGGEGEAKAAATDAPMTIRVAGTRWARSRAAARARREGVIPWQVGEQGGQFFPGAGAEGLPGSLVEFVGCDPAGLEGLAQLAERPIAVGVGYPEVARRIVPAAAVRHFCSFTRSPA